MKIIKAVKYVGRTVIRICHNPDQPPWVHIVGDQKVSVEGDLLFLADGLPDLVTSTLPPPGHTGETCHNCRYNWDVSEIVFDGPDLFHVDDSGALIPLSDDELAAAAFARASRPSAPSTLSTLEGLEV